MSQRTAYQEFRQLYAANVVPSALTDLAPTDTDPFGDGVYDCSHDIQWSTYNAVRLLFLGTDANNETFTARVWKWVKTRSSISGDTFVPIYLFDLTVTLGAGLYADTIVIAGTAAAEPDSYAIISPGNDRIAEVKLDMAGARYVQVQIGTTATAASGNVLAGGY